MIWQDAGYAWGGEGEGGGEGGGGEGGKGGGPSTSRALVQALESATVEELHKAVCLVLRFGIFRGYLEGKRIWKVGVCRYLVERGWF